MFDHGDLKHLRIFAIGFLTLALCACNPYPANPVEFKGIVSSWSLEQQQAQSASTLLSSKGFNVSRHKAEKYFDDQREYIYATQSKFTLPICTTEWRVILMLEHEQVVETQPLVFFNCI